jgi:Fe-S-cluster containining protein
MIKTTFDLPVKFKCLAGCGMCCSYKVGVKKEDTENIMKGTTIRDFLRDNEKKDYLKKKGGYCIFLNDKRQCSIYKNRPHNCRSYPFYAVGDQIDLDLSCPGIRQGLSFDSVAALKETFCLRVELTPEDIQKKDMFAFKEPLLIPEKDFLIQDSIETEDSKHSEICDNFFDIGHTIGTHLRKGTVLSYDFSLLPGRINIDEKKYSLPEVCSQSSGKADEIISSYLNIWLKREIFRRYLAINSILLYSSPEKMAEVLFKRLVYLLLATKEALRQYWNNDSVEEEFLRESIRCVDGRLREKCNSVNFQR